MTFIDREVDKNLLKIIALILGIFAIIISVKSAYQLHTDEQARILYRECLRVTEMAIKENEKGRFVSLPLCRL